MSNMGRVNLIYAEYMWKVQIKTEEGIVLTIGTRGSVTLGLSIRVNAS